VFDINERRSPTAKTTALRPWFGRHLRQPVPR